MDRLLNNAWLIAIGAIVINAAVWWSRGREHIERDSALHRGYRRLVLGFVFWGSMPCFVMGLGILVGGVESVRDYLRPREARGWVLAFYMTAAVVWALCLWWLFARGGAKALVDHPGLLNVSPSKAAHVKLLACGVTLASMVALALLLGHGPGAAYHTAVTGAYTTIFTVHDGFWRVVMKAALFIGVGVVGSVVSVIWILALRTPRWSASKHRFAAWFLLVWGLLWLALATFAFSHNLRWSYSFVRAYNSGAARMAEGRVHVLREQPADGHAPGDLVDIAGARLEVNYFVVTPAYTQTIAHGGALREGAQVRVWHHRGSILRVDIRGPAKGPVRGGR